MTATDQMRAMLDQLMGTSRNGMTYFFTQLFFVFDLSLFKFAKIHRNLHFSFIMLFRAFISLSIAYTSNKMLFVSNIWHHLNLHEFYSGFFSSFS